MRRALIHERNTVLSLIRLGGMPDRFDVDGVHLSSEVLIPSIVQSPHLWLNRGFTIFFSGNAHSGLKERVASCTAVPTLVGCELFLVGGTQSEELAFLEMLSAFPRDYPELVRYLSNALTAAMRLLSDATLPDVVAYNVREISKCRGGRTINPPPVFARIIQIGSRALFFLGNRADSVTRSSEYSTVLRDRDGEIDLLHTSDGAWAIDGWVSIAGPIV